tara:strand:+ start:1087 stop:1335 length:249 start_codon:yes stop_codon:yes gene_type:complete
MSDVQHDENPDLFKIVKDDGKLKKLFVDYVGEKLQPENDEVTVEMVLGTLAEEFPEVLLVVAEENFIRGYQQAMVDVESEGN